MSFAAGLKTIVVATDLDGPSEAALGYARRLATAYGARIVLAHGIDPKDYAVVDRVPGRVLRELTEQARAALDQMTCDLLAEGIYSHTAIRQGAVVQLLLDVVRQYEAGVIVIGTKGIHGAGPVVVGAIAEQLVRKAPCPVLAVSEDWNAGAFRPTPGGPVLLAMQRNEATASAVAAAYSVARTFQRPLLVLHARPAAEASAIPDPCFNTLKEFGIEPSIEFPVLFLVKDGNPADVIVEAIAENHPCVLVAGVKRASGTSGPHGTAFALLARSRAPVLCVPPDPFSASNTEQERKLAKAQ
jgi:nucleotide-binding universal stress UspA family protein